MNHEERIAELESEITAFDYERLKRLERLQQVTSELQEELADINQGVLTRRGEIICLKRLMIEEEPEK